MKKLMQKLFVVGALGFTAACASKQPSGQLVQARQAVRSAEAAPTSTNAPKDLYAAQKLLAQAEVAHKEDPRSSTEMHYAYLAHRKALTAIAHGSAESSRGEQKASNEAYTDSLEARSAQLKQQNTSKDLQLVQAHGKLEQGKLTADQNRMSLDAANKDLSDKNAALETEKQARLEADAKAKAALQSLQALAAVKEERDRLVITFAGGVLFESGKSALLGSARARMSPLGDALRTYSSPDPIMVEGHTDDRGADAANQQLSQARAEAVRVFLIENGVPPASLVAVGKGESQPVASNGSAEGRANNRRVEIIVPRRDSL
jgi:outer membrane protein OmpA-like peptidoglycan-associated protein